MSGNENILNAECIRAGPVTFDYQPQGIVSYRDVRESWIYTEYDIRGDGGSANREPRTANLWLVA